MKNLIHLRMSSNLKYVKVWNPDEGAENDTFSVKGEKKLKVLHEDQMGNLKN